MKLYHYLDMDKKIRWFAYFGDSVRVSTYDPCAYQIGICAEIRARMVSISTSHLSYCDFAKIFPHQKDIRQHHSFTLSFWKYHLDIIPQQRLRDVKYTKTMEAKC